MDSEAIRAFYELAQDIFRTERERFAQAEEKAWRHLYVLTILLGFALLSSGRIILRLLDHHLQGTNVLFLILFVLFLISASLAGLFSLWNFRVASTLEPPLDNSIEQFAIASSVDEFHLGIGREFIRGATENRQVADRKYRLLIWSFRSLISALSLGVLMGVVYLFLPGG